MALGAAAEGHAVAGASRGAGLQLAMGLPVGVGGAMVSAGVSESLPRPTSARDTRAIVHSAVLVRRRIAACRAGRRRREAGSMIALVTNSF